jgi:WD40 repeat protein
MRSKLNLLAGAAIVLVVLSSDVLIDLARGSETTAAPRSIFVMQPDGTQVRRVVQIEAFPTLGSPRWSHDGKKLAFAATSADDQRCLTVDPSGKNLLDLGGGTLPDWSPDDKQIVFEAPQDRKPSVWVQNSDGKGSNLLTLGRAPHWSRDGSQLALLGPLRTLDLISGAEREVFQLGHNVTQTLGCQWSPDGQRLAVVADRNGGRELLLVRIAATGMEALTRLHAPLDGGLDWSPDGKRLVVSIQSTDGIGDAKSRAYRLNLLDADGELLNDPLDPFALVPPALIAGQEGDNREPAWSPDGKWIAFASSRAVTGRPGVAVGKHGAKLELVRKHDKGGTVYSIGLSPDGRVAFLGGDMAHRGMQVWNATTGDVIRDISVPGIFVATSPDGLRAACAEFLGGEVQYLDLEDGSVIREFAHGAQVISLAFSGDGARLVSAGVDKTVCVFDVASGTELARFKHDDELKQVAFSPDGKLIASTCADKKLRLWDAVTRKMLREIDHPATPWSVAFSPDGRHVMTGTGGVLVGRRSDFNITPDPDNTLRIWEVESGKLVREMKGHTNVVASVAYSPDGKWALSGSFDYSLRLWDVASGQELSRVAGKAWVTKAIFSFDGKQVLASGGAEKNVERNRWFEAPDERVRLFKIKSGEASPAKEN